ncbi:hypothetical protein EV368DRAFT_63008 [Lentinula lateritia]|nr:hypothetical protein EV368DRAFT_63008 [Lentinula lateritia]
MTPQTNQLTALFLYAVLSQYTPQCTLQSRRAVKFTGSVRLLEAARHSKSIAGLSHCDHVQVRIDLAIVIAIGRRVHCYSLCKLLHSSCIEKGLEKSVKGAKNGDLSPLYLARYVIVQKVQCKSRDKRCMVVVGFGNRGKTRYRMFENIRVSVKADRGEDYDSHPEKLGKCHEVWTRIKVSGLRRERIHYGDNTGNNSELDGASAYARRYTLGEFLSLLPPIAKPSKIR